MTSTGSQPGTERKIILEPEENDQVRVRYQDSDQSKILPLWQYKSALKNSGASPSAKIHILVALIIMAIDPSISIVMRTASSEIGTYSFKITDQNNGQQIAILKTLKTHSSGARFQVDWADNTTTEHWFTDAAPPSSADLAAQAEREDALQKELQEQRQELKDRMRRAGLDFL